MSYEDNEFEKLNQQVHMEEERYLNAEVTIENYKFPHIYLTEEEIEQFNKDCEKYGYDIKAVPLVEYMNLNSSDKSYKLNEDDEIDMEEKEKNVDKFMEHLGKNFQSKKEEDNNKILGKKRKILDDSFEEEKSIKSSLKSRSIMSNRSKKSEISEKSNLTENNLDNIDKSTNIEEEKNNSKIMKNKKKLNKKKKPKKSMNDLSENFDNYFKKIKETRKKQEDDEKRKSELIKNIMESSQLLTRDVLNDVAKVNHFTLLDNNSTIRELDLQNKDVIQLDRIMVDININSKLLKLNPENQANIKKMKTRQEMEQKAKEEHDQRKMQLLREAENKKINENKNEEKKEEKKNSDISDKDSESDENSI